MSSLVSKLELELIRLAVIEDWFVRSIITRLK